MKIRTGILSLATGVAAVVLGVAPTLGAHAADGPGVAAFAGQASASVALMNGSGTFGFNSTACVAVDSDDATSSGLCTVAASGSFSNTVCGTGTADGTANISPDPSDGGTDAVGFHIQFVSGIGLVTGQADGVAVILPASPQPPPGCTNGFIVVTADVIP
jgi:hypothetical protein